ncbi:MAG TPA: JAB domain-containing protein, partial [Agathobacter rectalis]|nr:JAB domain-containing protein [Agathobacter rectalis]
MSDTVYVLDQVGIRLVKEKTLISDTQLKRPEQVVGFVSDILREYDREVMCVICLNAKLNPVNMCICSMGAVDKAIASPREIMKTVILSNANGFIILHNHPGGSKNESEEPNI